MTARPTIQERFEQFHDENPQVYIALVKLAEQWFATGRRKVAIGTLWEVLRWQTAVQTTGESGYSLNDHFRSRYARLLMRDRPDWAGRFNTRALRSA
jgi:hypothetical protein